MHKGMTKFLGGKLPPLVIAAAAGTVALGVPDWRDTLLAEYGGNGGYGGGPGIKLLKVAFPPGGLITSQDGSINCGVTADGDEFRQCQTTLATNDSLELKADAVEGFVFQGWSGRCKDAAGNTCTVSGSQSGKVKALFVTAKLRVISVGGGKIDGCYTTASGDCDPAKPAVVSCGGGGVARAECVANVEPGATVKLTVPDTSFTFIGWKGACKGFEPTQDCVLTMDGNKRVRAKFQ